MSYTKHHNPTYPLWKDYPNETTPVMAETMNGYDNIISDIEDELAKLKYVATTGNYNDLTNRLIPDGTTITKDANGTIHAVGGSGGTTNYNDLSNKPSINGVELSGNKTASDLGINIPSLDGYATESWVNGQGFLKVHQSLDGYATEEWVENKGYITDVTWQIVDGKPFTSIDPNTLEVVDGELKVIGGSGGTSDYEELEHKPSIVGNVLEGDKKPEELGICVDITQEDYNALSEEEKSNGTIYHITDSTVDTEEFTATFSTEENNENIASGETHSVIFQKLHSLFASVSKIKSYFDDNYNFVIGDNNQVTGSNNIVVGNNLTASNGQAIFGNYNYPNGNDVFQVGVGNENYLVNAFSVKKDGTAFAQDFSCPDNKGGEEIHLNNKHIDTFENLVDIGLDASISTFNDMMRLLPESSQIFLNISASTAYEFNKSLPSTNACFVEATKSMDDNYGVAYVTYYGTGEVYKNVYNNGAFSGWKQINDGFIKKGDTLNISTAYTGASMVTSAGKQVVLQIPIAKTFSSNLSNATITSLKAGFRLPTGGYLNNGNDNTEWVGYSGVSVGCEVDKITNTLRIALTNTNNFKGANGTTDVTNNIPMSYNAFLTVIFN